MDFDRWAGAQRRHSAEVQTVRRCHTGGRTEQVEYGHWREQDQALRVHYSKYNNHFQFPVRNGFINGWT